MMMELIASHSFAYTLVINVLSTFMVMLKEETPLVQTLSLPFLVQENQLKPF